MSEKKDAAPQNDAPFPPKGSTTEHSLTLTDGPLAYRAVADWITLRKVHKPIAHMFHTAYLATGETTPDRPITFVFNGGPGAASAYLHMGALGPQRVAFAENGTLPKPPTRVVDNHETWLGFTDLVFVDPVGTGLSRALEDPPKDDKPTEGGKPSGDPKESTEFWEINRDLEALGEFISRFLSRHHRWTSPIFIAGESYGGFRVAKMVRLLQENHGVGLCGAFLISPAIEFESLVGSDYDLTYWVEVFPSLAASAHQHGLTQPAGESREDLLARAEAFAKNDLARWLTQGDSLAADERTRIIGTMADLCGLPALVIERAGGRITSTIFCRELLRDQRRLCGHYDASITAIDAFPDRDEYPGPDPTLFSIDRLFTGGVNHQLRTTLRLDTEIDYRLLSMEVHQAWKDKDRDYVFKKLAGAMDDMRYGMSLNEHMKVFVAHGFFDLVTPYYASQRLVDLMKLTPDQRGNLVTANYPGGHMFYTWDESRIAFTRAAKAFFDDAIG